MKTPDFSTIQLRKIFTGPQYFHEGGIHAWVYTDPKNLERLLCGKDFYIDYFN